MAIKTFTTGEVLTAADTNTYLGNAGLVYVKQQTVGSGVTSVTVTGAFDSTYTDYKIVYDSIATTVANATNVKFNGSTGSTYNDGGWYVAVGTATLNPETTANTTAIRIGITEGVGTMSGSFDVFAPNLSGQTMVSGSCMSKSYVSSRFGTDYNTASHTAFTITALSGTMTGGTIYVYGYRKS